MKAIVKFILNCMTAGLLFPLFLCGCAVGPAAKLEEMNAGRDYVEHEVIVIVLDRVEDHVPHDSDALIDQGEVLMKLEENRKIVLVRDETRTASELVKWVSENDRVKSAELNRITQMTEER